MKARKIRKIIAVLEVVGDPDDGVVSVKTGCINGHGRPDIATINLENCFSADNLAGAARTAIKALKVLAEIKS